MNALMIIVTTLMVLTGGVISVSPEHHHHHHNHHNKGGNNFPIRRYAATKGGGGGGRPPPSLRGGPPGSPPRIMSRSDNGHPPLNNQTQDRYRRLVPYMTFYIPSTNSDFSLPINQAYNYMPIRPQRPQEQPQQHYHQHPHHQTSHKQAGMVLKQRPRHPAHSGSGTESQSSRAYQSYKPQNHQMQHVHHQGPSLNAVLISNAPVKYEYSQHHQLVPSTQSIYPTNAPSANSEEHEQHHVGLMYKPRHHSSQQQIQSRSPKLYADDNHSPSPLPNYHSIQPNDIGSSNGDGSSVGGLVMSTPAPILVSTRNPIKYQPVNVHKKQHINPFLPTNKLPGPFTPLAFNGGSSQTGSDHYFIGTANNEESEPKPSPSPIYLRPKSQTTYVLVKPSPEPNQLHYHEKPARLPAIQNQHAVYKDKHVYSDEPELFHPPQKHIPLSEPDSLDGPEYYKTEPKHISRPNFQEEPEAYHKPSPRPFYKPIYNEELEVYKSNPIADTVKYSTPKSIPIEYSTPRPHPIPYLNGVGYSQPSTNYPPSAQSVSTTSRPRPRHKPHHHHKHSRGSTKAPPVRQHLTENIDTSNHQLYSPNYLNHFAADYKSHVKHTYHAPQPIKAAKLITPILDHDEEVLQYQKSPRPVVYEPQHIPLPVATPTQIVDTATTSGSTSLADLLKKLQDSNHLPKTLTPDNIDNSIRTLVKILNNLKSSQQVHQQPSQAHLEQDYDYQQQLPGVPVPEQTPDLVLSKPTSSVEDDENETSQYEPPLPHSSDLGTVAPGPTSGKAGVDYPNLATIPETSFSCKQQRYKGFFGDPETNCQVWHYCDLNGGKASFLCPNGTIFSQVALTCDWWFNVKCSSTAQLYVLNERLYKYILPFNPKFPEDYNGPLVDKYLAIKFQEMEEKMKKQKAKGKPMVKSSTENENDELNGNKLEDNDERYNQNQPYPIQYVTEASIGATASTTGLPIVTASTPITLEDINADLERGRVADGVVTTTNQSPPSSSPIVVTGPSAPDSSSTEDENGKEPVTALSPMVAAEVLVPHYPTPSGMPLDTTSRYAPNLRSGQVVIEIKNDGTSGHITPNHYYREGKRK
ncbi:uncharacterized protein LOC129761280 isoform X2 [Toxorhynchites rutilus septentrionalis]|uniref:uncharacterized protein LOC129761280 isoform X2 n=1 Tax=Toxorhynchites rutilus septentrionalis TaxID=329112 RepID=UPI002478ABFF|nr:uncharacterized protein LOC129761280 isoform X2 [Toxorhynchites rutilus septentrionalis]